MLTIEKIQEVVPRISKQYGLKSAYLFGSYAKSSATANSDVDLYVDLGDVKDFRTYETMRLDIKNELGAEVDIVTTGGVKPKFFELIKNDRILLYGA